MGYIYVALFVVCAIGGFFFGKKTHLTRVARVMVQMKVPADTVDQIMYNVRNYKRLEKEAKKAVAEAYKQNLIDSEMAKLKKEDHE